jgi:hypothetical protein
MPPEFMNWISNVLKILLKHININPDSKIYESTNVYFKELLYGLNLLICHIKMTINHHSVMNIPIYNMCHKKIDKFFTNVNNMCIIMILLKLSLDGSV